MSELVKGPTQYQLNKLPRERILVTPNSNNPPTIVAGTAIYFNSAINTFALFTATTNQVFAWGAGLFPTITNSAIHYLWIDSSGVYGASKSADITVVKSEILDGWYSNDSTKKILCRFYVDSGGNVLPGSICILTNLLVYELYTTTTTAPAISSLDIIKDGGIWDVVGILRIPNAVNVYQFVGEGSLDTTDANYQTHTDRLYTAASSLNSALIVQGATNSGYITFHSEIRYNSGRYSHKTCTDAMQTNGGLWSVGGDIGTRALRVNINNIGWTISSGTWVVGSDIRIYRKS